MVYAFIILLLGNMFDPALVVHYFAEAYRFFGSCVGNKSDVLLDGFNVYSCWGNFLCYCATCVQVGRYR